MTYDTGLVALSIALSILGAFTALVVTGGIRRIANYEAIPRLVVAAIGIGGGVWSMHLVGLIALRLPIGAGGNVVMLVICAITVIVFTALALAVVLFDGESALGFFLGVISFSAGASAMYFFGSGTLKADFQITYSWAWLALSLSFMLQGAAATLWFVYRQRGVIETFLGAIALGLAFSAANFSALEATQFVPAQSGLLITSVHTNYSKALLIAISVYAVCGACIGLFAFFGYFRKNKRGRVNGVPG